MSFIFDLSRKEELARMGEILVFARAHGATVRGDLSRLGAQTQALTAAEVALPTNAQGQWRGRQYEQYICPRCQRACVGIGSFKRHTRSCQRRLQKGGTT